MNLPLKKTGLHMRVNRPVSVDALNGLSRALVHRANRVHLAVLLLSILMVPGAMKALEPIDMEAYDMASPELDAQAEIDDVFASSEVIVAFLVTVRDPAAVNPYETVPRALTADGVADWTTFPPVTEILPAGEPWGGIEAPPGGILNLSVLREIDAKANIVRNHPINVTLKPLVNDVTGVQTDGVMALPDIFRAFMSNASILTKPSRDAFGAEVPPRTTWDDCGALECLLFDDANLTQDHIDLAAERLVDAANVTFLRWLSLDRGFRADMNAVSVGPIGATLSEDGWSSDLRGQGRWSASASWMLVQLDRGTLTEMGWTMSWKEAAQETAVGFTEDGMVIGGFRLAEGHLVMHPPAYDASTCSTMLEEGEGPCSVEWSVMELEGLMRRHDVTSITLQVGQAVNVEVNRELQGSAGLIALMGLAIAVLLFVSLRRPTDVAIVLLSLGTALLWMQGLIGHLVTVTGWFGVSLIARSQFSNLLPILVMALGIDDSLHALHRYKEERAAGRSTEHATEVSLSRVGRAIFLTSLTTMAAFAANLFSHIAALRSFGVEAACGILAAFVLTGLWAPLLRMSVDRWLEARGTKTDTTRAHSSVPAPLAAVPVVSGRWRPALAIGLLALLLTVPAAVGMSRLEGDFAVEDFLDSDSDFTAGVNLVNARFSDEGEPAVLLLEGDVLDPRVFAAIDSFRSALDETPEGVPDKVTRTPDGSIDILALDEMVNLAVFSMIEDPTPFEAAGLVMDDETFGVDCSRTGAARLPDLSDRGCLAFFYGFLSLYGVPGTASIPAIPTSIVSLYITPEVPLNPVQPWLDVEGEDANYEVMLIRFGITRPEHFPSMKGGLEEIWRDLGVFTNLSSGTYDAPGAPEEGAPLTWVMLTGRPVVRYTASTAMQDEMQSSLILGALFVLVTLSIGLRSMSQALMSLGPILVVVVWLYGLMHMTGASLNIVTVTIATISLGVGIDYCIHVTERYRESRRSGDNHSQALHAVGGACGAALIGSAASDIAGFAVIATSPMGLFSSFGTFSAAMISLSLFASLVLTTAGLGLLQGPSSQASD
jgi:predicted RND superfamily exporter protein